jgi:hypothetical protein
MQEDLNTIFNQAKEIASQVGMGWYINQIEKDIEQSKISRMEKEEKKLEENEERKKPSQLYDHLSEIDYEKNMVFVEANGKHDKAMIRVFATKNGLKYRYYLNKEFDYNKMFKCKECKEVFSEKNVEWVTDWSTISPGSIYGSYFKCPGCYDSMFHSNDEDDDEFSDFKTWIPANCVIIGKNLGTYAREPKQLYDRKAKGDKTWPDFKLKYEINRIYGKTIVKCVDPITIN